MVYPQIRAIYRNGVLNLLDPIDLPEGTQVSLSLHTYSIPSDSTDKLQTLKFIYPTRFVPAERLDKLIGLVSVGGDALVDSEALYDSD